MMWVVSLGDIEGGVIQLDVEAANKDAANILAITKFPDMFVEWCMKGCEYERLGAPCSGCAHCAV